MTLQSKTWKDQQRMSYALDRLGKLKHLDSLTVKDIAQRPSFNYETGLTELQTVCNSTLDGNFVIHVQIPIGVRINASNGYLDWTEYYNKSVLRLASKYNTPPAITYDDSFHCRNYIFVTDVTGMLQITSDLYDIQCMELPNSFMDGMWLKFHVGKQPESGVCLTQQQAANFDKQVKDLYSKRVNIFLKLVFDKTYKVSSNTAYGHLLRFVRKKIGV